MSHALSSMSGYLASFWKSGLSPTDHLSSKRSNPFQVEVELVARALNQQINDLLPGCRLCKATLSKTRDGKLFLHSKLEGTVVFSDEKSMDDWLAEKGTVDIWEIEDLRDEESSTFYKLQKVDEWGYDTFETRDNLFDQLREDYGVFWKLEDLGEGQTSYIRFKTGLFGSHYVDVRHEDLSTVANNLKLVSPDLPSPSHASGHPSWGKTIAASVIGGLLLSAGRSWSSNQNSVSDAIATIKGTLDSTALKTAFVFQMSVIAAMYRQEGGSLPGALLAGIMFLPESVKGEPLCPQLAGSYDITGQAWGIALSGNYAYVVDVFSGLLIIDVSNVTNPTPAGSYNTPGNARGVAVSGNYAYVADVFSGLLIIDVSNVTNPTLAGFYNTSGNEVNVALLGNYAYVAAWDSGLQIIDVSNITNPTFAGLYDTSGRAYDVAVSGNYAYVADDLGGLQIIDVSNVANPTFAGFYDTPGQAIGIAVSSNYAYVADWGSGFQIIDVSNVSNPTLVGFYNTQGLARRVAVFGNYVYVADDWSGLQIIEWNSPCPKNTSSSSSLSSITISSTSSSITSSASISSSLLFRSLSGTFSNISKIASISSSSSSLDINSKTVTLLSAGFSTTRGGSNVFVLIALVAAVVAGIGVCTSCGVFYLLKRQQKKGKEETTSSELSKEQLASEYVEYSLEDKHIKSEYALYPPGSGQPKSEYIECPLEGGQS